jgi:hypothetical protein
MVAHRISRRSALKLATGAAVLPLVNIHTAGAAGRLSIGFWDHWVPEGNAVMKKQVDAWAAQNKVDVQLDFITSNGNKLGMTASAEAQAGTGHDVMTFGTWTAYNNEGKLADVSDVVRRLTDKYGPVDEVASYLGSIKDRWFAVPTSSGTQNKPPCARPFCSASNFFLGHLEIQPEPECGQGSAGISDAARAGRGARCCGAGLRLAALPQHEQLQGMVRGKPADRYRLQLSDSALAQSQAIVCRILGPA